MTPQQLVGKWRTAVDQVYDVQPSGSQSKDMRLIHVAQAAQLEMCAEELEAAIKWADPFEW